ncbi:hypothetical protein [Metaclostridioides mangenotii]|uniref:hypothetical protein n=1 Tax=Metaclostridioides mangenotii TaxID=1540 RepID=UPI0004888BAA|nr:hypothetical protein [Clostridioides mangenotii]
MNLATYNFKDNDKSQVPPITQNIKNKKLRDTIITRHDGYEHINQYAFISVIAGALKEEIQILDTNGVIRDVAGLSLQLVVAVESKGVFANGTILNAKKCH